MKHKPKSLQPIRTTTDAKQIKTINPKNIPKITVKKHKRSTTLGNIITVTKHNREEPIR